MLTTATILLKMPATQVMHQTLQRTQAILPTRQRTAARILQRTATTLLTSQTATKYYPGLYAPLHN